MCDAHLWIEAPPENETELEGMVKLPAMGPFPPVLFSTGTFDNAIGQREQWLTVLSIPLLHAIKHAAKECDIEVNEAKDGFDITVAPLTSRRCIGLCRYSHGCNGRSRIQIDTSLTDPVQVAHVLLHEMVHAMTEGDGHRLRFPKIMKYLDTTGKMTASSPGDLQTGWLTILLSYLPEWSDIHKPFAVVRRGQRGKGSRMVKIQCIEEECGAVWRMSRKWIATLLCCPCCESSEVVVE